MPDNFIQQPENTQNYNRYTYVLNNPLKYTDPSGELFGLDDLAVAIIIGAVVSGATYTLTALLTDVPFSVGGLAKSMFIGAASGAVTFGIGSGAENLFTNFFSRAAFQSLAHGTFQGGMTAISGGKFWSGFAAGALSSIAASAWSGGNANQWQGLGGNFAHSDLGTIAFGTVSGGAAAKLTGGNFWQGAVTGLFVSALNHVATKMEQRQDLIGRLEAAGYNDPRAYANLSDSQLAGFAQKVLPELYAEAKSPRFESREFLTDTKGNSADGLTVGGEFSINPKIQGSVSKILLSKNAFSSYLKLASTMGHELNHAADYVNGNMARWYNKGGHGYRSAMSEAKAYNWQFKMPGAAVNLEAFSSYNHQVNLWNKLLN